MKLPVVPTKSRFEIPKTDPFKKQREEQQKRDEEQKRKRKEEEKRQSDAERLKKEIDERNAKLEAKRERSEKNRKVGSRAPFAKRFYDFEAEYRKVKPYQWGLLAAGGALAAGASLHGLSLLAARLGYGYTAAVVAGSAQANKILRMIPPGVDRRIFERTVELARSAATFPDKVLALARAVSEVTDNPTNQVYFDKVSNMAYGIRNGYGIALVRNVVYIIQRRGVGFKILGRLPE